MGQLVMLILPAPASLDTIRGCLTGKFDLNPRVEGLGDADELHATNESGRTTIFERVSSPVSELLQAAMRQPLARTRGFRILLGPVRMGNFGNGIAVCRPGTARVVVRHWESTVVARG